MPETVISVKRERRWLKQSLLFIFYQLFKTLIPIFIIGTQFDLLKQGQSESKYTGWGLIVLGMILFAFINEMKKTARLKRDETKKEFMESFLLPTIMILFAGVVFIANRYYLQLMTIFIGGSISVAISLIFEYPYNKMLEENRLIKEAKLQKKIEKHLT